MSGASLSQEVGHMITLGKKAGENENKRYAAHGLALGDKDHVW